MGCQHPRCTKQATYILQVKVPYWYLTVTYCNKHAWERAASTRKVYPGYPIEIQPLV